MLLLQAMANFEEKLASGLGDDDQSATLHNKSCSMGLAVKRFWNKLVHIGIIVKQLDSENKTFKRSLSDCTSSLTSISQERNDLQEQVEHLTTALTTCKSPFPLSDTELLKISARTKKVPPISRNENHKSSQTIETAFVPCDSCDSVQQHYRRTGDVIIELCHSQNLPASLKSIREEMAEVSWMSGSDISRWAKAADKDIQRVKKCVAEFDGVKTQLATKEGHCAHLQGRISELEKCVETEKGKQGELVKQFEKQIETTERNNAKTIVSMRKEKESIVENRATLEEQLQQFKSQLQQQEVLMKDLEQAKGKLQDEFQEAFVEAGKVSTLEEQISSLQGELSEKEIELQQTAENYSREKALNQSIQVHTKQIQEKQQTLMTRLESLDQENEDLRLTVQDVEESRETLEEKLRETVDHKDRLEKSVKETQSSLETLTKEKEKLENSMTSVKDEISRLEKQVKESNERVRLLIENPDQSPGIRYTPVESDDITVDMQNQIKANSLRIQVLEEQNTKLRRCVAKILQSRDRPASTAELQSRERPASTAEGETTSTTNQFRSNPVQLWASPSPLWTKPATDEQVRTQGVPVSQGVSQRPLKSSKSSRQVLSELSSVLENTRVDQSITVGPGRKTPSNENGSQPYNRPPSGKSSRGDQSAIKAYKHLKKTAESATSDGNTKLNLLGTGSHGGLSCPRCYKNYQHQKDLDLHMGYCRR